MSDAVINNSAYIRDGSLLGFKLFPRLLVGFLVVPVVSFIALMYFLSVTKMQHLDHISETFSANSKVISAQINGWVDSHIRGLELIAELPDIVEMQPAKQRGVLFSIKERDPAVTVIFTLNNVGQAVARSDDKTLKNYSDRDYFQTAMLGQNVGQQVLIGKHFPEPLQCLAVPIDHAQQRRGVLTQCASLQSISEEIAQLRFGNTGYAFLVDDKQRLIAHGGSSIEVTQKLQDMSAHPALAVDFVNGLIDIESKTGVQQLARVNNLGLGWKLVLVQDRQEAYQDIRRASASIYLLFAMAILLTLLLSVVISGRIALPLRKLQEAAEAASLGDLRANIPEQNRGDEIGDLARSFARMHASFLLAIERIKSRD